MTVAEHNRLKLASEQLNMAITLFLEGISYVSALTLAGAAEEVFGKALSSQLEGNNTNFLDWSFEAAKPLCEWLYRRETLEGSRPKGHKKYFIDSMNYAKNSAKHFHNNAGSIVTIDLKDEAMSMITRALYNSDMLGLTKQKECESFDRWYYENVIGLSAE